MALPVLPPLSPKSDPRWLPRNEELPKRCTFPSRRLSLVEAGKFSDLHRDMACQTASGYSKSRSSEKFLLRSEDARCTINCQPQYPSGRRSSVDQICERNPLSSPIILTRFVTKTEVGGKGGKPNPQNQDRSFYQCRSDYCLIGVCDGHGPYGHVIAGFISAQFPQFVSHTMACDSNPSADGSVAALTIAYSNLVERVRKSGISCEDSGSTCVSVLIRNNTITCGNVGDSRAVLGRLRKNVWTAFPLSRDHRPSYNSEYQRIVATGGQVAERHIEGARPRIYLRNKNYPGLHISRSIGDTVASLIGVTSDPEVKSVDLTPEDKFVILASDGVWEIMESLEVVETMGKFWESGNADCGCDRVKNEARARWAKKGKKIPDVTVSVGFFGVKRG